MHWRVAKKLRSSAEAIATRYPIPRSRAFLTQVRAFILFMAAVVLLHAAPARAQSCPTFHILSNDTTADASQVMDNFDHILQCPVFSGHVGIGTSDTSGGQLIVSGGAVRINNSSGWPSTVMATGPNRHIIGGQNPVLLMWNEAPSAANNQSELWITAQPASSSTGVGGGAIKGGLENSSDAAGYLTFSTTPASAAPNVTERMRITSSGNVGVGTGTPEQLLDVAGTIRQQGCMSYGPLYATTSGDIVCSTSDPRLKNIHGPYRDGLRAISHIEPIIFSFTKPAHMDGLTHVGFNAQNVKASIPEASTFQANGNLSLDTTAILAASVSAINQLKQMNDFQASRLKHQEILIGKLSARLSALEKNGLSGASH